MSKTQVQHYRDQYRKQQDRIKVLTEKLKASKSRVAELEAGVRLILAAKGAIQDFDAKTTLRGILTQRGEGKQR